MVNRESQYRHNIFSYFGRAMIHIIPAYMLGINIERLSIYLQKKYNLDPLVMVVLQLTIAILIFYIIEKYISLQFAFDWQSAVPGIFFTAIFFNAQPSIVDNIKTLI